MGTTSSSLGQAHNNSKTRPKKSPQQCWSSCAMNIDHNKPWIRRSPTLAPTRTLVDIVTVDDSHEECINTRRLRPTGNETSRSSHTVVALADIIYFGIVVAARADSRPNAVQRPPWTPSEFVHSQCPCIKSRYQHTGAKSRAVLQWSYSGIYNQGGRFSALNSLPLPQPLQPTSLELPRFHILR